MSHELRTPLTAIRGWGETLMSDQNPDPVTLTVKLTYRAADKVLLGAQIAGAKEAAVRIDTFACAVDQGMTTDELGFLDLGYAPPFASVWDAIAIAANASK